MLLGRPINMTPAVPERRTMRRFEMRLPALVRCSGTDAGDTTETVNVSARGVFFYTQGRLAPGDNIEVTLTFPPHVTMTEKVRVRFSARVVRVEQRLPGAPAGIAAAIEGYEFLRSRSFEAFAEAEETGWS